MPLGGGITSGLTSWPDVKISVDFTHDPTSASFTWVDLTVRAWTLTSSRGRGYELATVDTGTAQVTMRNDDGALDPTNPSSPFWPNVIPYRRLQVTATWSGFLHNFYTGLVERWPLAWDAASRLGRVDVGGVDYFALLTNQTLKACYAAETLADNPLAFYPLQEPSGSVAAADLTGKNATATIIYGKRAASTSSAFGVTVTGSANTMTAFQTVRPAVSTGSILRSPTTAAPTLPAAVAGNGIAWRCVWATTDLTPPNGGSGRFAQIAPARPLSGLPQAVAFDVDGGGKLTVSVADVFWEDVSIGGFDNMPTIGDGNMHDVVASLAYNGANWIATLYCDGVQVGSTKTSTTPGSFILAGQALHLGGYVDNTGTDAIPFSASFMLLSTYNAPLSAARVAALYNAWKSAFSGDTADARINRILGYAGWAGPTAIDACITQMGPATDLPGSSVLAAIQSVETAEGGAFFVSAAGALTYQSRRTRMATTVSSYAFGDNGTTELPFEGIGFDHDPTYIYSDVEITRTGRATQVATDATSAGHFGQGRQLAKTFNTLSNAEALDAANWLLASYKDPHLRISSLVLNPASNPALWPAVLSLEVGSRITVTLRPNGAHTITGDYFVEKVTHNADKGASRWLTTLVLSPIPLQALIANDPVFGICDSTFVAAW